jgi:threonylcarbamoyladenosine tRNA methylthiotransferase MtaB
MTVNPTRYSFITLGCKVNQYDSDRIREILDARGLVETNAKGISPEFIFINTCTVTATADKKSFIALRKALSRNPNSLVFLMGCAVDYHNENISLPDKKRVVVIKNEEKPEIDRILRRFLGRRLNPHKEPLKQKNKLHTRAFIKVQDGCENFCSYCVVPFVRGRQRSKPIYEVISEVSSLLKLGFKEIVLSGICLGSYGRDLKENIDLAALLENIEGIEYDFRVRLSSIEPRYITDKLIKMLGSSKKLCPHIHIPFQSGDDGILKRMNRPYTASNYADLVDKLRFSIPDVAITTDIMVGFPGESDENFYNTISFLRKIRPSRIHIFPYSDREKTYASSMGNKISSDTILERLIAAKELAMKLSFFYRKGFLNRVRKVLIESKTDKRANFYPGYSENYIKVQTPCRKDFVNNIVDVRIKKVTEELTIGELAFGESTFGESAEGSSL